MRHDQLADVFSIIKSTEKLGRKECITPCSKLIEGVLSVMKNNGYIGEFKKTKGIETKFRIELLGRINDCCVIKPRFSTKADEIIKFEKRFLPSSNVGILILSTPKGIMDQKTATESKTGGVLLGYVW